MKITKLAALILATAAVTSVSQAFDLRLNLTVSDPLLNADGTPVAPSTSIRVGVFNTLTDAQLIAASLSVLNGDFFEAVMPSLQSDSTFVIGGIGAGLFRDTTQVVATSPTGGGFISLADYNSRLEGDKVYLFVVDGSEYGLFTIPAPQWQGDETSVGGSNVTTNATFNFSNNPVALQGSIVNYGTAGQGTATGHGLQLIPEPTTALLALTGLATIALRRRRA